MKHDPAFSVLLPFLQACSGRTLWIADDGALDSVAAVIPSKNLEIISNRFDVVAVAKKHGHVATFSDFDFACYEAGSFSRIVYRVSKEKAVVHHAINCATELLSQEGQLIMAGIKQDGTKTYLEKCKTVFGNGDTGKKGAGYLGIFTKMPAGGSVMLLDDQHYASLRLIHAPQVDFYSKPGVFGWDRIDEGSAFLISALENVLTQIDSKPASMLDLGCGYGYLTLMARTLPLVRRVATDNNAAALLAMRANAGHYALPVDVVAGDAGSNLHGQFDLILCNPPFHRGFSLAEDLTDRFLQQASRLLDPDGMALFVVNAFIPVEQKAASFFQSVRSIASNRSYKVILARKC